MDQIGERTLLHYPDLNKQFLLETDAIANAMGAVLKQDDKIIGFYSKKFNETELNYSIVEKEILAILRALNHFKTIIFSSRITIKTDNKNLTFNQEQTSRIQRWKLQIEEFDYELEHIPGQKNTIADLLSRLFSIRETEDYEVIAWDKIRQVQESLNDK
jgi:putative transposase